MKNKELNYFDWDNISINKFYEIQDILNDDDSDDMTKQVELVAVITGKSDEEIWNMGLTESGELISKLKFMNKFELPKTPNLKVQLPSYKLVVMKDLSKMTTAQFYDFQAFSNLPLRDGIDKLLSIFMIPEDHKYNTDYDVMDVQKEIRENISFRQAQGLLNFFMKGATLLLHNSLTYCTKQMMKTKDLEKKQELEEKMEELKKKIVDITHLGGYA